MQINDIAEPTPALRWITVPSGDKVLQQAWLVTSTYAWGEIIDKHHEWRDVPTV